MEREGGTKGGAALLLLALALVLALALPPLLLARKLTILSIVALATATMGGVLRKLAVSASWHTPE
jgi:hypothetical protein